jgi:hexosaminidase
MVHTVTMPVNSLRWRFALLGTWVLLAACQSAAPTRSAEPAPLAVIPAAASVKRSSGAFIVTAHTRIAAGRSADDQRIARYFADLVQRTRRLTLPVDVQTESSQPRGGIAFLIDPGGAASPEAYSLAVGPAGVTVSARDRRGLFYGAITLWQLMGTDAGDATQVSLPALRITDEPRFRWRGLMLDSARHYQSPEFIERFIDWMALHKLNVLHWHLTDDQGWRLEIRKYPRLTQVGAWRVPAGPAAAADIDPATGKPRLYGGYYSQDTVRRIVRYAAEREVTIVPEIEMPGHATAATVAYPQLGVDGHATAVVPSDWGIYPNLFNVEDATFEFIEDVLREVLELFPGEYIHVGGDEAVKDQWKSSPRVQQLMRERGIADEHALQSYFIQRVGRFLSAHGRRLIGWDEILEGGLAEDATVMSWRGIDGALAAAAAGHDAVLSPWPTLYLDNRQGAGATEPPGRGRVISLEDVYSFDPMPATLPSERYHHILGVQANLWTEHMRTEERAQWMVWPRAAAIAEIGWSLPERRDFADFRTRLESALGWYRALGLRYADTAFRAPAALQERRRTSQDLKTCADKLVLNLEDDAPVRGERAVFLVDIMQPCWIFEGADLTRITSIAATVGQFPFNFQIGKDRDAIHLRPPQGPDGELEVRVDACDGEPIVVLPLGPAAGNAGVTRLPAAAIASRAGRHDLCFTFTGRDIDPMWAIDSIELVE